MARALTYLRFNDVVTAELGPEDLILARETALEGRLPFRLAALTFRPFVKCVFSLIV